MSWLKNCGSYLNLLKEDNIFLCIIVSFNQTSFRNMPLIFLQIRQVAPQELLLLSAAQGVFHWEEQTVINPVAAVQRIHLRKALASEMCGSVLRFVRIVHVKCLS
jgi:hypothetical protein